MTAAVITAKNSMVTVIESVTPLSDTAITYKYLSTAKAIPDGASAHRKFWFRAKDGGEVAHMGPSSALLNHNLEIVVHLNSAGYGLDGFFDFITQEAVLLKRAINKRSATWGAYVDQVRCDKYSFEPGESDDILLVLSIYVLTTEVD